MRFVFGFVILSCLMTQPVYAQETNSNVSTPVSGIEILQSPLIAKIMYRDAWEADNQPDLSYLIQIEKMQRDGIIDKTSVQVLKEALPVMQKMSYGMKGKDIGEAGKNIQSDPEKAINQLAESIRFNVSEEDLNALTHLRDQVEKQAIDEAKKTPGQTSYPIDISAF